MHRLRNILTSHKSLLSIKSANATIDGRCYSPGLTELNREPVSVSRVEDVYERWLSNPDSVGRDWDAFFRRVKQRPDDNPRPRLHARGAGASSADNTRMIDEMLTVAELIRSYQFKGHYLARLDPLELSPTLARQPFVIAKGLPFRHLSEEHTEFVKSTTEEINTDQEFKLPTDTFIGGANQNMVLKEIIKRLEETYCRNFGIEYAHIPSSDWINWVRKKFEIPGATKLSTDVRRLTLARLIRASCFENFLAKKYPTIKRFSAEGGEAIIPLLKQILDRSTEFGVDTFILSMAHRGRLNIVANVCRMKLKNLFKQFQPLDVEDPFQADLKYHLGVCVETLNKVTNKQIKVVLLANPSHLQCSAPLCLGKTKAEQMLRNDLKGKKAMAIIVHGDTAVCGQGVSYEAMNLSDIPNFTTYGVVHIIMNNQVGFTTLPLQGRSFPYCSDLFKLAGAPVIHVNGHDPDAVVHAANVASEWRATARRDICIDMVAYRKFGHDEGDEPRLTQPAMYAKISQMKSVTENYRAQLIDEGIVKPDEAKYVEDRYMKICEESLEEAKKATVFVAADWNDSPWKGFFEKQKQELSATGVAEDILMKVATAHASPPPTDFVYHKNLERVFSGRTDLINKKIFDWSLAEACAIGTLLNEGYPVRLSGEDSERGAYAHRHYVLHHQETGTRYIPLMHISPDQAKFTPINSPLSEYGVLGYEFGYSQSMPDGLTIWEAQFGDFVDVAQCILDCFICCGESKWQKQSGLVINLPHGLDGTGPDHSSGRLERFLVQCVDDPNIVPTGPNVALDQLRACNWIVANVTTPANLFHILRRQVKMPFRKPLCNYYPKSLLRYPPSRSPVEEFKEGTSFKRIIPDPVDPAGVKKVLFSVGKVYYEFLKERKAKTKDTEIALIRIEQVYPFPFDLISAEIAKYPNATFCFGQEEHMNMGCNGFVIPRLQKLLPGKEIKLISRPPGAASSVGLAKAHLRQLRKLMDDFINA